MTWKFHVQATAQRRLFSRILQILENQMVSIHAFTGETSGEEVRVTFFAHPNRTKHIESKHCSIDWKMFGAWRF